ncbi:MAG: PepSY-associated TM helix domain-containing protein [Bacteroidota bacterium]
MSFNWRRWNNILHRDVGYLTVAMTLMYGISGLAVNHVADWNPNYTKEKEFIKVEPFVSASKDSVIAEALEKLKLSEEPKNFFRPDPETAQLFYQSKTYSIDLPTGNVLIESTARRPVLFEMNQLHLNAPKGIWTYIADLFAVGLIFMGFTGLFMLKGKTGLAGRGKWFVGVGISIPLIYWLLYLYT